MEHELGLMDDFNRVFKCNSSLIFSLVPCPPFPPVEERDHGEQEGKI